MKCSCLEEMRLQGWSAIETLNGMGHAEPPAAAPTSAIARDVVHRRGRGVRAPCSISVVEERSEAQQRGKAADDQQCRRPDILSFCSHQEPDPTDSQADDADEQAYQAVLLRARDPCHDADSTIAHVGHLPLSTHHRLAEAVPRERDGPANARAPTVGGRRHSAFPGRMRWLVTNAACPSRRLPNSSITSSSIYHLCTGGLSR